MTAILECIMNLGQSGFFELDPSDLDMRIGFNLDMCMYLQLAKRNIRMHMHVITEAFTF